jgi:hypothetical protein
MRLLIQRSLLAAAFLILSALPRAGGVVSAQPVAGPAAAQPSTSSATSALPSAGPSLEELSNQAANPNAPLTQLQLRNVIAPRLPGFDGTGNLLQLQAIVPVKPHQITPFPLIMRLNFQVPTVPKPIDQTALGNLQFFAQGVHQESWGSWGLGFTVSAPTETFSRIPSGPWQLGPSVGIIYSGIENLVLGGVFQNPISLTAKSGQSSNQLSFVPSITYTLPGGWFFGYPDFAWTVNWQDHGAVSFPVGLQVGKIILIGKQPFSVNMEGGYTAVRPHNGTGVPRSMIGIEFTALFPAL